jgi:hypothetical protein
MEKHGVVPDVNDTVPPEVLEVNLTVPSVIFVEYESTLFVCIAPEYQCSINNRQVVANCN